MNHSKQELTFFSTWRTPMYYQRIISKSTIDIDPINQLMNDSLWETNRIRTKYYTDRPRQPAMTGFNVWINEKALAPRHSHCHFYGRILSVDSTARRYCGNPRHCKARQAKAAGKSADYEDAPTRQCYDCATATPIPDRRLPVCSRWVHFPKFRVNFKLSTWVKPSL